MRFREQTDGSLMATARGVPPKAPPGFMHNPNYKYHYIPVLEPCDHRVEKEQNDACCGHRILQYCVKKDKYLVYKICLDCKAVSKKGQSVLANRQLYQALYDDESLHYGSAAHNRSLGFRRLSQFKKHLNSPVIDLGCGTGDTVRAMQEAGFAAQGMDWIQLGNQAVCDITEPQDLSIYETAICIDVLEHITDDKILGLFENLKQAKQQVVTVFCGPSKERGYNQELHTNIKTPEGWVKLLEQHFDIQETVLLSTHCYLYLMRRKDAISY